MIPNAWMSLFYRWVFVYGGMVKFSDQIYQVWLSLMRRSPCHSLCVIYIVKLGKYENSGFGTLLILVLLISVYLVFGFYRNHALSANVKTGNYTLCFKA